MSFRPDRRTIRLALFRFFSDQLMTAFLANAYATGPAEEAVEDPDKSD
jgi:hypothetical protein